MVTFSKGQSADNCDNVGPKASQRGDVNERYSLSFPHHTAPTPTYSQSKHDSSQFTMVTNTTYALWTPAKTSEPGSLAYYTTEPDNIVRIRRVLEAPCHLMANDHSWTDRILVAKMVEGGEVTEVK